MSTLTTMIHYHFGSSAMAIMRRKRNKGNPNWKRKLSLFVDDMILYIENPKDATRKVLVLINESGAVAGYRINAQKLLLSYTLTMKDQKEKLRK